MTTEYKLLLRDENAEIARLNHAEGLVEPQQAYQLTLTHPKNILGYQVYNPDTPDANAKDFKVFSLQPTIMVSAINAYNAEVNSASGFVYKPTAIMSFGESVGNVVTIDSFQFVDSNLVVTLILNNPDYHLSDHTPLPESGFGHLRLNINGLQSTALLEVLDTNFFNWLNPTYDKLNPYPYVAEDATEEQRMDIKTPGLNFFLKNKVEISDYRSGQSKITITNPGNTLSYGMWNPSTPFTNQQNAFKESYIFTTGLYTLFRTTVDAVKNAELSPEKYAWYPALTLELVDGTHTKHTYIGKLMDVMLNNDSTDSPSISFIVSTTPFLVYPNKRFGKIPAGSYDMLMDIDNLFKRFGRWYKKHEQAIDWAGDPALTAEAAGFCIGPDGKNNVDCKK